MDIIKYLKKANINVVKIDDKFITVETNKITKKLEIKKLEQYLFICLVDYINE
jgi:hypothetical protein